MTTKELREKRVALIEEANAILKKAADDKREMLRPEDEETWQRLHNEGDSLKRHIDMREKQEAVDKSLEDALPRVTEPNPVREERGSGPALRNLRRGHEDSMRALRSWLLASPTSGYSLTPEDHAVAERCGISLLSKQLDIRFSSTPMRSMQAVGEWEYRAQGIATGAAGAFTVPDELMREIEIAMLTWGGMRARCRVIRTDTGAALPWPTVNDTTQKGVILAENTQVANQDVVFAQLVLDAYKYSSKQVLVSAELLQDTSIPLAAVLGELLGTRIGRITNEHFTTGTGSGQPNGIVTAATNGFTAANADAQVTTWKYASIVETEHSVDPAYRGNASWMMHDSTVKKTKQIVDTTGRPLWAAGIAGGAPDTLMGYPIVVNQDMAVMAASAKSVLFGDLSKYLIRDVVGVTLLRLEERFADFHQVAFLAFSRHDGDLLNAGTNPVKTFINAAS